MINEEWISQGSELRKMTMICDFIDSAAVKLLKIFFIDIYINF